MPLLACAGTLGEPDVEAETNGPFVPGPLASPVLPGQTKYKSVTADLNCRVLSTQSIEQAFAAHNLTDVCDLDAACYNTMQ